MKVTYDPYADALYLWFNNQKVVDTKTMGNDIIVDYAKNNLPVGMEILSISNKTSNKSLKGLQFELNTKKPTPLLS